MPLIKCPDCGREVSPSAPACLQCGRPIATPPVLPPTVIVQTQSKAPQWVFVCLAVLLTVVVVIPVVGLLAAIAIPNFVKARSASQRSACIMHLKSIEQAKETWAVDYHKSPGDEVVDSYLFGSTNHLQTKPMCTAGGTYQLNPVGSPPTCSIPGHAL